MKKLISILFIVVMILSVGCTKFIDDTYYYDQTPRIGYKESKENPILVIDQLIQFNLVKDNRIIGIWNLGEFDVEFDKNNGLHVDHQLVAEWSWVTENMLIFQYPNGNIAMLKFIIYDEYAEFFLMDSTGQLLKFLAKKKVIETSNL